MPDFRDQFSHRIADMCRSDIWPILIRDYMPRRGISGDGWITQNFHKISANRGQPTAIWRGPIFEPKSRLGMPDFRDHFAHRIADLFCTDIWEIPNRD